MTENSMYLTEQSELNETKLTVYLNWILHQAYGRNVPSNYKFSINCDQPSGLTISSQQLCSSLRDSSIYGLVCSRLGLSLPYVAENPGHLVVIGELESCGVLNLSIEKGFFAFQLYTLDLLVHCQLIEALINLQILNFIGATNASLFVTNWVNTTTDCTYSSFDAILEDKSNVLIEIFKSHTSFEISATNLVTSLESVREICVDHYSDQIPHFSTEDVIIRYKTLRLYLLMIYCSIYKIFSSKDETLFDNVDLDESTLNPLFVTCRTTLEDSNVLERSAVEHRVTLDHVSLSNECVTGGEKVFTMRGSAVCEDDEEFCDGRVLSDRSGPQKEWKSWRKYEIPEMSHIENEESLRNSSQFEGNESVKGWTNEESLRNTLLTQCSLSLKEDEPIKGSEETHSIQCPQGVNKSVKGVTKERMRSSQFFQPPLGMKGWGNVKSLRNSLSTECFLKEDKVSTKQQSRPNSPQSLRMDQPTKGWENEKSLRDSAKCSISSKFDQSTNEVSQRNSHTLQFSLDKSSKGWENEETPRISQTLQCPLDKPTKGWGNEESITSSQTHQFSLHQPPKGRRDDESLRNSTQCSVPSKLDHASKGWVSDEATGNSQTLQFSLNKPSKGWRNEESLKSSNMSSLTLNMAGMNEPSVNDHQIMPTSHQPSTTFETNQWKNIETPKILINNQRSYPSGNRKWKDTEIGQKNSLINEVPVTSSGEGWKDTKCHELLPQKSSVSKSMDRQWKNWDHSVMDNIFKDDGNNREICEKSENDKHWEIAKMEQFDDFSAATDNIPETQPATSEETPHFTLTKKFEEYFLNFENNLNWEEARYRLNRRANKCKSAKVNRPTSHVQFRPKTRSNKQKVILALKNALLPGNVDSKLQKVTILDIDSSRDVQHFLVLMGGIRLMYKGVYAFMGNSARKISGTGPDEVTESVVSQFYKYDCASREFIPLHGMKTFSIQTDGFTLKSPQSRVKISLGKE